MATQLNPFLYICKYENYNLIYVPYKHRFFIFSPEYWEKVEKGEKDNKFLRNNRIIVEENYREKFLENYSRIINNSNPQLNLMYLLLTDNCNFRCPYCFIEGNYKYSKRDYLDWETARKSIDYFFENSDSDEKRIIFYGGEPLLNREVIIKAIKRIRQKSKTTHIGINTNGSFYDEELSKVFKDNGVIVSVSLDGFKKINDKTRLDSTQKGTFDKVSQNVKKFLKDGVKVSFSITINGHNIDYLPAISKFVTKEFPSVDSIGFNLPLESLQGNNLSVDPEYCAFQLYNSYRILRRRGVYEDRVLRRLKHIINENVYLQDCGGCGNQMVVHPSGVIGPCHGFAGTKKYFDYNINNLDFKNGEVFKKWNKLSPVTKKYCTEENCPFLLICGNSCPYYSEITKGNLEDPDERMYPFLSIFMQEVGKDLNLKAPKAIAADYDGTLVSRKPSHEVIEEVAREYGYNEKIDKKDFYDIRKIFENISNKIGKKEKINDMIYLYLKKWKENSRLNTPLINQLKKIKKKYNVPIYIFSNNKKDEILRELEKFGEGNIFEEIFDSEEYKKPSKDFLDNVFKKIGNNPEDIFYVGDSFFSDIRPIYSTGLRGAASFYANPEYFSELNNDWLVDIFDDYNQLENGKSLHKG